MLMGFLMSDNGELEKDIMKCAYLARVISKEDFENGAIPSFMNHSGIAEVLEFIGQVSGVDTEGVPHVVPLFDVGCRVEPDESTDSCDSVEHDPKRMYHGYYTVKKVM